MHYSNRILLLVLIGLLIYLKVSSPISVKPTPYEPEVPAKALADIDVEIPADAKAIAISFLTKRQATIAGWNLAIEDNSALRFKGTSIEVEGGITAKGYVGPVPLTLTLKAIELDGSTIAVKFKYGVLRVNLL